MKDDLENDNVVFLDQYASQCTKENNINIRDIIHSPTHREETLIQIIETMAEFIIYLSEDITRDDLGFAASKNSHAKDPIDKN